MDDKNNIWPTKKRPSTRSKPPFGYKSSEDDPLVCVVREDHKPYMEQAFQFIDDGQSLRKVAAWLREKTGDVISHQGVNILYKTHHTTPPDCIKAQKVKARKKNRRGMSDEEKRKERVKYKLRGAKIRATAAVKKVGKVEASYQEQYGVKYEPTQESNSYYDEVIKEKEREKEVLFKPNPGPQTEFLAATEREVLYGGPLHLDTPVVTPNGYVPMRDIQIGDIVYTKEGNPTRVVDIPFEGEEESYLLEFGNGAKVIASEGHRWEVFCYNSYNAKNPTKIKRTIDLFPFKGRWNNSLYYIDLIQPVKFPEKEHFLHPYFVGAMIGDGCVTRRDTMSLAGEDFEIAEYIDEVLPFPYRTTRGEFSNQWRITRPHKGTKRGFKSEIWEEFKRLGLAGHRAIDKFIPKEYLLDSVENRLELLRGLMDTDGTVRSVDNGAKSPACAYCTTSERLKEDFVFLAKSLGYTARVLVDTTNNRIPSYVIHINGSDINPFKLTRKVNRFNAFDRINSSRTRRYSLINITPVGKQKVKCITVEDKTETFLIDQFTTTMNSAGGGKSFALIADPLRYFGNKNFNGVLFRRTLDELRELRWSAQELYPKAYPGAKWSEKNSLWTFPSGARFWMTYLERDEDVLRYQGQAFCWIGFDELTHYSSAFVYNYLRSRLRTTDPTLPLCIRSTTNPGSGGAWWVRKMFIDPAPPGEAFWATDIETGKILTYDRDYPELGKKKGEPLFKRRFIPARLHDNPYLYNDGQYLSSLLSLPEEKRKQLLDGDWNTLEGAAFTEFNVNTHVVAPFEIPHEWRRFRSCDFGYSSYSAVHWYAIDPSYETLIVYRELYTTKKTGQELANMILDLERNEDISYGVLDSSVFHTRGQTGPTIAEEMISVGCRWRPSDRSAGSRINGKNRLHELLRVDPAVPHILINGEYGRPGIIFFNTCRQIITDLPSIPSDPKGTDDIDVRYPNDHTYDSIRYGIMSRPRGNSVFDFMNNMNAERYRPANTKFGY